MSELIPCPQCRRHVRASELSCPFCAAPSRAVASPSAPRGVAKFTRAALFAGAALLVPACGSSQKKPDTQHVVEHDGGGGAVKQGDKKADETNETKENKDSEERYEEERFEERRGGGDCGPSGNNCPPYGAPPAADDRIV